MDTVKEFLVPYVLYNLIDIADGIDNVSFLCVDYDAIEIGMYDIGTESFEFGNNLQKEFTHQIVQRSPQGRIV